MAETRVGCNINLNNNELLNAVVEKHGNATIPSSPVEGQIYYNTDAKSMFVWTGSVWLDLGDIYDHPNYTPLNPDLNTDGATVLASLSVDAEGHVDGATTRLMTLADLGYTGDTNANHYIHPNEGVDLGGALSGATIISDVNVNAKGHVTGFATRELTPADIGAAVINDSVTNGINTWSSSKIQSELDAINSTVAGALVYKGGYNASTNSPNLDSSPSAGAVVKGYTYTVTVAGTFFSTEVQAGDMIIAETDDPSLESEWTIVNKNIPDIVDATTTDKGIVKLATQALVDAGTDNTTVVTPLTLKQRLDAFFSNARYAQDLGDGVTTDFTITHGLGSSDVVYTLVEKATGNVWWTDTSVVNGNSISVKFNTPPTTNQFRFNVIK
jgi:hypothetical protein